MIKYNDSLIIPTGWMLINGGLAIERIFTFSTFLGAMAFMNDVAQKCEKLNHHPEWTNLYTRVSVRLTTHETNGLTELDITLANEINNVFSTEAE